MAEFISGDKKSLVFLRLSKHLGNFGGLSHIWDNRPLGVGVF